MVNGYLRRLLLLVLFSKHRRWWWWRCILLILRLLLLLVLRWLTELRFWPPGVLGLDVFWVKLLLLRVVGCLLLN